MSATYSGEAFEAFQQCCLCDGAFILGGDPICQIEFETEPGVVGYNCAHVSCVESDPKCLDGGRVMSAAEPDWPFDDEVSWRLHQADENTIQFYSGVVDGSSGSNDRTHDVEKALKDFMAAVRPVLEVMSFTVGTMSIQLNH